MTARLVIRGFAGKVKRFEDRIDVPVHELDQIIPELATKHAEALAAHELHMIEIEFLDEPNPEERFFRFGTDPRGMVAPIRVRL
jgi:hypothetical protein